jgi:hypothetical protein
MNIEKLRTCLMSLRIVRLIRPQASGCVLTSKYIIFPRDNIRINMFKRCPHSWQRMKVCVSAKLGKPHQMRVQDFGIISAYGLLHEDRDPIERKKAAMNRHSLMTIATLKSKMIMTLFFLMMLMGLLPVTDANANHGASVTVAKGHSCRVYVYPAWTSFELKQNCQNEKLIYAGKVAVTEDVNLKCPGYCVGKVEWICVDDGNKVEQKTWNEYGIWPACYHVPLSLPTQQ